MNRTAAALVALLLSVPAFGQHAEPKPATTVPATTLTPATPAVPGGVAQPNTKGPIYDESADARKQIAAALAKAKKENRRVLIQWGGNWCGWCTRLHELMTTNQMIAKTVLYEYDVVHIDAGRDNKNADLIKQYNAKAMEEGFPYLTVLDADGKVIANQDTGSLEVKDSATGKTDLKAGHDPAKVNDFLKKNAAAPLRADDLLAAGVAEAKSSGRTVFVHFGAPWCGWCHKLEDWMARPEIATVLAKDFVDVKIDIDRTTGGKELIAKYRGAKDSGIPWFVFLDADAKAIITSEGPQGNTGFPSAPEEVEHFATMLAKVRKKMTESEAKGIIDSLKTPKP